MKPVGSMESYVILMLCLRKQRLERGEEAVGVKAAVDGCLS